MATDQLFNGLWSNLSGIISGGGGAIASSGYSTTTGLLYHSGGIAGMGGSSRTVSSSLFNNAPRYHSGGVAGLKPDEVPAILQRGERVIPRGSSRGGGDGNNMVVQVVDQRSSGSPEVEQQRSTGPNGEQLLRLFIRDEQSKNIASGRMDNPQRARFGSRPRRN
ncbi:hypothetical protein [Kaistia sp. MMO-174]|uniref:hypothetical protein n=1 Tax=Kaistia sp. MMO-174 TaxID=3081256 RepID=UPI00301AE5D3